MNNHAEETGRDGGSHASAGGADTAEADRPPSIDEGGAASPHTAGDGARPAGGILAIIENLREITERCFADEPLGHDLAEWLGSALDDYLTRQSRTIEEALGLIFPKGGIPWWREEANRKRDEALRYLAETFLVDLSPCKQANEIWTIAMRYAASAWRFDRESEDMPERYAGSLKECLWRAFKSGAAMPLGERQLRNILAH